MVSETKQQIPMGSAMPRHYLVKGNYYIGICRNASVARWDGEQFWYWRLKWGKVFLESIKHRDDDGVFDVFDALTSVQEHQVQEIPLGEEDHD